MLEQLFNEAKDKMQIVEERLKDELAKVQTGRASTELIESVRVDYYGTQTPLKQMASINVPQSNMIVIQPWDKGVLGVIETAISKADLGYNPTNDGQVVRIILPQMTSEDKEKFIKVIHEKTEAARIALRNVRKDIREQIEKQEKAGELTEDDKSSSDSRLNKLIDEFNSKLADLSTKKETDLKNI